MKEIFSKINVKRVLSYALYMFLALVAQNMLFTQFRLFGTCPMVLPAVAVAVGMFQGATWIFADMAYVENTVTFTLIFPALAFAAGFISQFFINRRFFAFMGAALAGLFVTALVQMLKTLAADGFSMAMVGTVLLQTLWSLPPAALAYFPPAKWIE